MKNVDYFSQSQINIASICPFQWKCYMEHVPQAEVETKYATSGSVIHEAIEEYYKIIDDSPHEGSIEGTFNQILDRKWKAAGNEIKGLEDRREKARKSFVTFEQNRLRTWKQFKPTFVEETLRARLGGFGFLTRVDSYWKEEARIIDWKPNKQMLGPEDYVQGQVAVIIFRELGLPLKRVDFFSYLTGNMLQMPAVNDEFVLGKVRQMLKYVMDDNFPRNKDSPACKWCGYGIKCTLEDKGICMWRL